MIPLDNTARIEGEGAPTGRNGSAGHVHGRQIKFPITQAPEPVQPKRVCPKCGGSNIRRSRRRLWEKMTTFLHPGQRVFRCFRCYHRFWNTHEEGESHASRSEGSSLPGALQQSNRSRGRYHETDPHIPLTRRIDHWLYRKHNLTIGTLFFLMLIGGLMVIGVVWALKEFAS